ncbi:MAG: quinol dehydrogenase ferredoxin subunit NapH [Rubrivivax sp.]|nr:quinol dehydrogenase ferredoxin subunit NapH [Rubrivivax sp.]
MSAAPSPAGFVRRPVRHLEAPVGMAARLHALRYTLARRAVQLAILVLFYGTLHGGWSLLGAPLLAGNLSASEIAGVVPMADPFAVLQMLVARHWLAAEVLAGAAVTLALYLLAGGRSFCAWVCPMNIVTDTAAWLRGKLGLGAAADLLHLPAGTRYGVLALALLLSAITGVAAFEWFSPIAMLHRELLYGAGLGLTGAAGILLLDTFAQRRGWCGHLCPLGAFWALVGRVPQPAQVRVALDDTTCSRCGDCIKVCPEPRVLHLPQVATSGGVLGGECTNCGRCIAACPESSLRFALRGRLVPATVAGAAGSAAADLAASSSGASR